MQFCTHRYRLSERNVELPQIQTNSETSISSCLYKLLSLLPLELQIVSLGSSGLIQKISMDRPDVFRL